MQFSFPRLDLLLDVDEEHAQRAGEPVDLSPLSCRLLAYLAHNRDRVVPREELLREVWDGVRVTDASLRQGLRILRRELGLEARNGAVVESVRGRGYRLTTPVEEIPAHERGRLSFIGRAEEVRWLLDALEEMRSGTGRLVLLSGPPGIGKTRLAEEVARRARRRGFQVLAGRCAGPSGSPPLWPFEQALRSLLAADPTVLDVASEADRRALELGILETRPDAPAEDAMPPGAQRLRLFEAMRHVLAGAAAARPLLVWIDDVHEADEASLALLEWLAGRVHDARVLLLAAHRSISDATRAASERFARLLRAPSTEQIVLEPLRRSEVEAAIRAAAPELVPTDVDAVWDLCGGNPFFLRLSLDAARRSSEPDVGRRAVLHGAREAVLDHLAVLSEPARETLTAASVFGPEPVDQGRDRALG